ncbi:DNA/RNA non-specific endonuclease [Dokdonia sp. Hel_I_53]|uniref:DNA/RNA non-specific endonuclease n=1 Tax=Dokdonia sp. Hel_I_53 TaxID=1566287 RepID=UPI00119A48E0|nr:DNA/RNA non-specific endonuclease [Dokdonia sp. Hel_I_53]TVZ53116.1 endonuclease G [Dokdonia sp. Hel_I_53]
MKRKYLYPLLVALFTLGWYAFEQYANRALDAPLIEEGKKPKVTTNTYFLPSSTTDQVIHHHYYSLSYSEPDEQAEWVAYELKKNQVVNADFKRPYFEVDPKVPSKSAHWRNYKNSGYDRGHLCPAADREFSKEAFEETFLTSNITPQRHVFNAGVWNRLEQKVRYWAKRYDGVFVITGGVLKDKVGAIGTENVTVAESFYKIVYDQSGGNKKMIAFLMNHAASEKRLQSFVTSVDQIETLTGIDFFPNLDDETENKLEAAIDLTHWRF